jgi:hypothetical protein
VITLILAGIGALVGTSFIEDMRGVALPSLPAHALKQSMGITLTVAVILTRLIPFIAGAIGGAWGAKTGQTRVRMWFSGKGGTGVRHYGGRVRGFNLRAT